MSAGWIQALAILAIVVVVLAIVFWSMLAAAHRCDEMDEEAARLLEDRQLQAAKTIGGNLLLIAFAVGVYVACSHLISGPDAIQAEQDIDDEVAALEAEATTLAARPSLLLVAAR